MILIFGFGLWFWTIILVELIALTWLVEADLGGPSVLSVAVFILLLWWIADIPIFLWIKDHPGTLAMYCLYYFIAGVVWSIAKYFFVLKAIRKIIKNKRKLWDKMQKEERPVEITTFEEYVKYQDPRVWTNNNFSDFKTTTKNITFWAAFWPPSMLWTIINDPIRKAFKFVIHDLLIGVYRNMHKSMVEDLVKEPKSE